jgi:hypothetical protein
MTACDTPYCPYPPAGSPPRKRLSDWIWTTSGRAERRTCAPARCFRPPTRPTQCGPPPPAARRARPHRSHAAARMARSRGFCFNTLGSRGATASHDHHADKAHADSVARALARHGTLDIVATCEGGKPCRLSDHCGGLLLKHWALSPPRPTAVALLPKPKITNLRVRGE